MPRHHPSSPSHLQSSSSPANKLDDCRRQAARTLHGFHQVRIDAEQSHQCLQQTMMVHQDPSPLARKPKEKQQHEWQLLRTHLGKEEEAIGDDDDDYEIRSLSISAHLQTQATPADAWRSTATVTATMHLWWRPHLARQTCCTHWPSSWAPRSDHRSTSGTPYRGSKQGRRPSQASPTDNHLRWLSGSEIDADEEAPMTRTRVNCHLLQLDCRTIVASTCPSNADVQSPPEEPCRNARKPSLPSMVDRRRKLCHHKVTTLSLSSVTSLSYVRKKTSTDARVF